MLTNHDMDSRTPFATVLVGQPTLRRMIKLGVLAALDQRIAVRYQMTGMTPEETGSYIRHHEQLAGRDGDLFSDDATAQIHDAARGKAPSVNLAIAALIATYTAAKKVVEQSAERAAISEVISAE
jgi:type II secretory pathway predicted ATPase ExeA